ncbi:MAG: cation-translocating P-type ATPase [Chloroflexota bacterium]
MTTHIYTVKGMDCADCANKIEKGVSRLAGVQEVRVDFATSKLHVGGEIPATVIDQRVQALGYSLDFENTVSATAPQVGGVIGFWNYLRSRHETRLALIGGAIILFTLLASLFGLVGNIREILLIAAISIAGYPIARSGLSTLFINRDFNINLLMTIAAVGALIIGEPLEGATVIFLFAIGESLEGYTADRARDSLRSLVSLAPVTAIRLTTQGEEVIPVEQLKIDDTILVKPGERVAMDGVVTVGESDVDQAPITGESVPVYKSLGAEVYAGTINGSGLLKIRVTHLAADNTLSRIIHLVETAQSERAPSQRLIDAFARVYTPAVVGIAALMAVIPPVLFHAPFWEIPGEAHGWLYRALSLLVIACPCALVISAPVTVISGITAAARRGVLIKGGMYLEALGQIRAFAFDKTGTLTQGKPIVTSTRAAICSTGEPCPECDNVLALASAVEQGSTHPLAKAVVSAAQERGLISRYLPAEKIENLAGRGVRGTVNGQSITIGSHSLFDAEYPHSHAFHELVNGVEAQGQTAMLVTNGEAVQGYITVADTLRDGSRQIITDLKALGITPVLLTGDNQIVAQAVGQAVGVEDVRAGLLPADKVTAIKELLATYRNVAMIGDGINDTPALAAATVGIAMGAAGSAQARETADVALMADDLNQLPFAIRLARFTRNLILQNVGLSLATKLIFLVLALFGGASLWLAILADVGISLLVTLNGMRPLSFERSVKNS